MLQQWVSLAHALPARLFGLGWWLLGMAALFGVLERWRPLHRQGFLRPCAGQDVAYYFLGGVLPAFFLAAGAGAGAWVCAGLLPQGWHRWVGAQPLWLRFMAMLVLGDAAYYWAHRALHELPWLWRLHVVHHSPKTLDWLVNTRAHPLDLAFARTVSALPVVALGLWQSPSEDLAHLVAAYLALSTVWAFVVHSNLHWRLGWLEQFIVSPAFHHWHHAGAGDGPAGINYASLLPWLDRLFGTHHLPRDRFPQTYGVDESQPDTLLGQLLSPFRRDSHPRIPAADAADAGTRIRRNRVR